uniref:Glycosyl transferase family 2 n=1 Tax=Sphingobacterium sp. (strain 21) TaxID=743722 RepID=F4CE91_SPHS2
MSSKKFTRWIDRENYKVSLKIASSYYSRKENGESPPYDSLKFWKHVLKRLFFVFITLFRFNKNPYAVYRNKSFSKKIKRMVGIDKMEFTDLLNYKNEFKSLEFPVFDHPVVSIVICVHNQIRYTYNCLASVLMNTTNVDYEVIVVDDYSSDSSLEVLKLIENIKLIINEENLGFLKSSNRGASYASGQYICFLNNDTQVRTGWLSALLATFDLNEHVGLVGAKLVYPYGLIQEAGGIVNYKGEPANYGKFEAVSDLKYNYLRETDYCSGACILLLLRDFNQLGGFSEEYAPAYYEDTDLCFAIRYILKKRVYYQPLAEVVHYEGVSSGKVKTVGNVKRFQEINAKTFKEKWQNVFSTFNLVDNFREIADKFLSSQKTILFIEPLLPLYDKDSGSRRIFEIIKICLDLKYRIIFLPEFDSKTEPYYSRLTNMGVWVLTRIFPEQSLKKKLLSIVGKIDVAWVCRPSLNEYYQDLFERQNIFWIYDTVDLHFLRLERELELKNTDKEEAAKEVRLIKEKEIELAKAADLTLVVTPNEASILKDNGIKTIEVIPNIHVPKQFQFLGFEHRSDLCFIGGYRHQPNVDAAIWLVNEIMPLIWKRYPDIKLNLLGSYPPEEVVELQSDRVYVPGYLPDVSTFFITNRVFVAPLRYGAGMKGKIGQSLEYGLPVVTTTIGAEGMNLENGKNVLIADDADNFAKKVIDIYTDEVLWNEVAMHSMEAIEEYTPERVREKLYKLFSRTN